MISNAELVNLLVQTKRERLEVELADLTAQLEAEASALRKEGEDILTLLSVEATAQTHTRWLNAVRVLADSGCFDTTEEKKPRQVVLRMTWDNPFNLMVRKSWGYYGYKEQVSDLPHKLVAYVHVNDTIPRVEHVGLLHVSFKPSTSACQRWKGLYAKVEAHETLRARRQEIENLLANDAHTEKRALALLTKRTLELNPELKQQVALTIADILSDTKLLTSV